MVIYTRRGDKGDTSIYDEVGAQRLRVSKDSLKVEVLGAIDELNSYLGIVKSQAQDESLRLNLRRIQKNLLKIGSIIAGSNLRFSFTQTKKLEKLIDGLEEKLPVLRNFIVPGGVVVAAQLQYARALARRTERRVVALGRVEVIKPQILTYLNRLSDFLFMLARSVNYRAGIKDEVWVGKRK